MGTWGVSIFDDDLAIEVKGDYEDILESGLSHESATKTLMVQYADALKDAEESSVFWLTLATIQLRHNTLTDIVKSSALEIINSNRDLLRWEDSPDFARKKQILEELRSQLLQD